MREKTMSKEYITIAEYAKIKGVSTSSVYKRLTTTLQPYYIEVENGKKALKSEVLEVEGLRVDNLSTPNLTTPPQEDVNPSSTSFQPSYIDELLKEKDKQIEELKKELAAARQMCEEKDTFIMENTKKLLAALEQSQELQRNNQILMARQQEVKQLDDGKKKGFFDKLFRRDKKE